MNGKSMLLPRMAVNNIRKNGSAYFPYIGVSIFAVFTYFVFDLILKNDVMLTIPRAMYAILLIQIGFWLLGIIMVPFLYYTNSFLIKRRKKELGLYSILGLEKKHIGIMMLWESVMIYGIVVVAAIGLGLLFSRLIFLVLLNLAHIQADAAFSVSPRAVLDTVIFYAFITALNLLVNLFQVGRANPVELMSDSGKGEKEPKHIALWTILGILFLGLGYYMGITAELNSMIFMAFFGAVLFVVAGTWFLFTSGSIALLRTLKRRKKYYYKADNFVTVSGMLYRMKKSAASLSNICVFGTMVVVTVVCTVSLYLGMDSIISYLYPRDFKIQYDGENRMDRGELRVRSEELAEQREVEIADFLMYFSCGVPFTWDGNIMRMRSEQTPYEERETAKLMTLAEYNQLEGTKEVLDAGEVLVYGTGPDFGYSTIVLGEKEYRVKRELTECLVDKKARANTGNSYYLVVLPDEEQLVTGAAFYGRDAVRDKTFICEFTPRGTQGAVDAFYESLNKELDGTEGFAGLTDYREGKEDLKSMYGGLLFIGIFFGLIFLICLLIIMYYKQITEGFEDQKNFEIMQKVGMSGDEIRRTIKKQILLVFALPLLGAVCHTLVAMNMVTLLLGVIGLYEVKLIFACAAAVVLLFAVFYSLCYRGTAGTYYRIVSNVRRQAA